MIFLEVAFSKVRFFLFIISYNWFCSIGNSFGTSVIENELVCDPTFLRVFYF